MNQHLGDEQDDRHPDIADGGKIARSIPCKHCSYDLKGLPVTGRCPECGKEIRSSLERIHADGLHAEAIEAFANGLKISGNSWLAGLLVVLLMCPCGCYSVRDYVHVGWAAISPMASCTPLIAIFLLTPSARALSARLLKRGEAFMPDGLPFPSWLLVASSSLTVIIGLGMIMTTGPITQQWLPLCFALCVAGEGALWHRFVARCAVSLEHPFARQFSLSGTACWSTILVLLPLTGLLHVVSASTNQSLWLWPITLYSLIWGSWLMGSILTGLFMKGLSDVLPQLVEPEPFEETLDPLETPESHRPLAAPEMTEATEESAPIELADAPGIIIEPEERGSVDPPRKPDPPRDPDNRPDVY
jgi:hypothetical protein